MKKKKEEVRFNESVRAFFKYFEGADFLKHGIIVDPRFLMVDNQNNSDKKDIKKAAKKK